MDDPKRVRCDSQDFFEILLENYKKIYKRAQNEAAKLIQKKNLRYLDYLFRSRSYGES